MPFHHFWMVVFVGINRSSFTSSLSRCLWVARIFKIVTGSTCLASASKWYVLTRWKSSNSFSAETEELRTQRSWNGRTICWRRGTQASPSIPSETVTLPTDMPSYTWLRPSVQDRWISGFFPTTTSPTANWLLDWRVGLGHASTRSLNIWRPWTRTWWWPSLLHLWFVITSCRKRRVNDVWPLV